MIENWTKLIQPTGSESWLNETMVFCYLRNKKQTGLQVYHSCGIYEVALQLLDQWIYKQRFRKHNQVKIRKKKNDVSVANGVTMSPKRRYFLSLIFTC